MRRDTTKIGQGTRSRAETARRRTEPPPDHRRIASRCADPLVSSPRVEICGPRSDHPGKWQVPTRQRVVPHRQTSTPCRGLFDSRSECLSTSGGDPLGGESATVGGPAGTRMAPAPKPTGGRASLATPTCRPAISPVQGSPARRGSGSVALASRSEKREHSPRALTFPLRIPPVPTFDQNIHAAQASAAGCLRRPDDGPVRLQLPTSRRRVATATEWTYAAPALSRRNPILSSDA